MPVYATIICILSLISFTLILILILTNLILILILKNLPTIVLCTVYILYFLGIKGDLIFCQ